MRFSVGFSFRLCWNSAPSEPQYENFSCCCIAGQKLPPLQPLSGCGSASTLTSARNITSIVIALSSATYKGKRVEEKACRAEKILFFSFSSE